MDSSWRQEDKKTVAKYISTLRELNTADGRTNNGPPLEAAQILLRLSNYGVKAIFEERVDGPS